MKRIALAIVLILGVTACGGGADAALEAQNAELLQRVDALEKRLNDLERKQVMAEQNVARITERQGDMEGVIDRVMVRLDRLR